MEIKTLQDIIDVSNKVIGKLVVKKGIATFGLVVDHGDGSLSNCAWTPAVAVGENQKFLAVEDYEKIMLMLQLHSRISHLSYNEKENLITAVFNAPELEQIRKLENPSEEFP